MPDTAVVDTEARGGIGQNLAVAALGIVYGDIGTSPLYTVKQCFDNAGVNETRVFGVLSLIAWSLTLVVTVKYVLVMMRADNRGEGGILALMVLAMRAASARRSRWIMWAGLIGAALFYGDGVITPSISVLSAVEGLTVATPALEAYVVPLTLLLLVTLFIVQRRGTGLVGGYFGPIMILWFGVIGILGGLEIARHPSILLAVDPRYAVDLLLNHPWHGFVLLGSVVLAVTGAEALYADMGHFGPSPVRRAWLRFVFPSLLLNYFGQGALLLAHPGAIRESVLSFGPRLGALSACGASLDRHRHRLAGGDIRSIFDHPSGSATGLSAADAGSPHLRAGNRTGLCAGDQRDAAGRCCRDGVGLSFVRRAWRRVWHRRHRYDDGHHHARLCLFLSGGGLAAVAADPAVRVVPDRRPVVFRRQPVENPRRRLVSAGHCRNDLRGDDDLAVGPRAGRGPARERRPAAGKLDRAFEARPPGCAFRAPRST